MKTSLFVIAACVAAAFGLSRTAQAQYGAGPQSQYNAYSAMPGMPVGYAPEVQAPASSPEQAAMSADCDDDCYPGYGCNRWYGFAEFLYLRARDSEVAWAVPIDGATDADPLVRPPVQVGRVGVADLDYQPGYRVGFGRIINEASAFGVSYTEWQGNTHDVLGATAPNVLRPLVTHPSTFNAASDYLDGAADYGIRFKTIDIDYHSWFAYCCEYNLGYTLGVRYGQLQQHFRADYAALGTEFVDTESNFYGSGLKAGLDGEKYSYNRNLFVYGKTFLSLLGGESQARYDQGSSFDPSIVSTTWQAGRLVTIYDLELGAGWQNDCGTVRLSAGYMYSIWYNVTRTNEWINAVQHNNFADPSDNFNSFMSFDGLVTRLEIRW
jgi:hypothetical protein